MATSPLAGKPVPPELLTDVRALVRAYYETKPDGTDPKTLVHFGTSGHRGTPLAATFNEAHVVAMSQAICDYRRSKGIDGPLFIGKDTHAVSGPAERTALTVLAAAGVEVRIAADDGVTPTPAVSLAILQHNSGRSQHLADGIVVTPSHNPPRDAGFKYNPPEGGPASTEVTKWIQDRANQLLRAGNREVKRLSEESALRAPNVKTYDYRTAYVAALDGAIDMAAIKKAGVRIGVDALGGAAWPYWDVVREKYGLDLTTFHTLTDPTFAFMTLDHDGELRTDCSSPYCMASLVRLADSFDVAFANDGDADRHGIVTKTSGLMNPNHYLVAAIHYLLGHRPAWAPTSGVGKTIVSSTLIDRVVLGEKRKLVEVPVGFKWFAPGLFDGSLCFGGEESAGASFLRRDGKVWTTDKDGPLLGLLAAEMTAVTGKNPAELYGALEKKLGSSSYTRIDSPAGAEARARAGKLSASDIHATTLAGDAITATLTHAPGNGAAIGGVKVTTDHGWFAARPSGTEDILKLYAESFRGPDHLQRIVTEAKAILADTLGERGA